MEVVIRGKNFDVTPRLHEYVEAKAERLSRHLGTISEVRVDLAVENTRSDADRQVAQVTVLSRKAMLRAEERTDDMFASIDAVLDKLLRQIERYKGKRQQRFRAGEVEVEFEAEAVEEETATIARVKGHDFFLFYNAEEAAVNLVYRRRDGNYGLLQPVLP
jgi:putative sigma-54 modulation protein